MSISSNEKSAVKPIVFNILIIAHTNTEVAIMWWTTVGLGGGRVLSHRRLF